MSVGKPLSRARGRVATWLLGVLAVVALVAIVLLLRRSSDREVVVRSSATAGTATTVLPPAASVVPAQSTPGSFEGCPADGDGGDRALNRLKNRQASAPPRDIAFDSLLALPWPAEIGGRYRSRWPARTTAIVARHERQIVRVEGYVARARTSGPESTNCHGEEARLRDFHIWLTAAPTIDRTRSIVAEMTPRWRARHAGWNLTRLGAVSRARERVRVTGWLLLDQEHPEQVGRTRGTIWEVHPVTAFEVQRGRRWIPLDSLPARGATR